MRRARAEKPRILASMRALIMAAPMTLAAPAAHPAEVVDNAAEAESLLAAGKPAEAFEALEAAVDAFWSSAPLTITDAYLVTSGAQGAAPPSPPTLAAGEPVTIHLAPVGYGFEADGRGFRIGLRSDIEIRTPGGLILAKSDDFGRLEWSGPLKNRAFSGRLTVGMPALKSGRYELVVTVTDDASQKTASVTLPFEIAGE